MLLKNEALQNTNPLKPRFHNKFVVLVANLGLVSLHLMIDLNGTVFKVFFDDNYYNSVAIGYVLKSTINNHLINLKSLNFLPLKQTSLKS